MPRSIPFDACATVADPGLPISPLIARALDWLEEHAPADNAVGLCKGSNGAMQEVWRDGRIVALSDWELASIGDPANDRGRCQGRLPDLPGRWPPRHALDYYRELTGVTIPDASLASYRAFYALELTLVAGNAGRAVRQATLLDARLMMLEMSAHYSSMQLARLMFGSRLDG